MIRITAVLFALAFILAAISLEGKAQDFYQWQTGEGTLEFTDDPKRVPQAYQDQAVERSFEEASSGVEEKFTLNSHLPGDFLTRRLEHLSEVNARTEANPNRVPDCSDPITVVSERVQVGHHNRRMFVTKDECGETVSVTPFYPDVQINR